MKAYEIASGVKPTERQIKWQDTEFNAIIYYGMNTFTGRETGDGFAVPSTFCPENIDTDSWAETVKQGGMTGLIITAKHYDGFCNWPTATTDYSVKSSNWLEGKGDLVKLVSDSARKHGLKFGIYFPVCDMHEKSYKAVGETYNKYLLSQINELVSLYGELFEIILDDRADVMPGTPIDYGAIYKLIREKQPECAICFRGPDGRWVGNDRAVTRKEEWSVIPASYSYGEDGSRLTSNKKPKDNIMELDLGSRKAIKKEENFVWYPCEVNFKMRNNFFFKKDDEYSIKTKDKILDAYYKTVGNNANLLLCLAPDKMGKLNENEIQILRSTGKDLQIIFGYNLIKDGKITSSSNLSSLYKVDNVISDNDTFWSPDPKDKKPELTVEFTEPQMFDKVIIKENIRNGQQMEKFTIYISVKDKWKKFSEGTAVGHKKICACKPIETDKLKIVFEKYRNTPEISYLQIN